MEALRKEARYLVASNGKVPCEELFENLKDRHGRAMIRARIRRMEMGNPGNCRFVGRGVMELKIPYGPGYRIYYGEDGDILVILLCGGDKSTQHRDVIKAHNLWNEYWRPK